MIIFRAFLKTQSDQNIHQKESICTNFLKFSLGSYVPEPPSIGVQLINVVISTL